MANDKQSQKDSAGGCGAGVCGGVDRRAFLKAASLGAASAAAMVSGVPVWAQEAGADVVDHYVPAEKKLDPRWVKALYARGKRIVYRGQALETIGMPCGGVCAGMLYVRGDGTLAHWWIGNNSRNTGFGGKDRMQIETPLGVYKQAYQAHRPTSYVDQGFAIRVKPADGPAQVRKLSRDDFDDIRFIGEYPVAEIEYGVKNKSALPVSVKAEIFSPFIPLNTRDSALPATIMRYTVKNTGAQKASVTLAGWQQNAVCLELKDRVAADSRNRVVRSDGLTFVHFDLVEPANREGEERRVTVFEDFEKGDYANWTVEGEAFGKAPAKGTLDGQQKVSGFSGKGLVNTFLGKDGPQGRLLSKAFKVSEKYITFLVGGGSEAGKTCMNLLVGGKAVRTIAGQNNELLTPAYWDVEEFVGKEAQLEIVDSASSPWGHINIDKICFSNAPVSDFGEFPREHPQFGEMALAAFDEQAAGTADWGSEGAFLKSLTANGAKNGRASAQSTLGQKGRGAVASSAELAPGAEHTFTFVLSWFFPNRGTRNESVGNMYRNWFDGALGVTQYVKKNFERLCRETQLFRKTYYEESTLPHWFMHRIATTASTLATETCQWWADGRFWAWEGVGCCAGTCTHVWNYAHAHARLFPELARSAREKQDFGPAYQPDSGLVGFRGDNKPAFDGQAGTVLKAYREHLTAADGEFLKRNYPRIKGALQFLIDRGKDGLIRGSQHNTFDINFEGANTFVGSLYLAALRAGEEMAKEVDDAEFAKRCRTIFESGRKLTLEQLYDGEYFFQDVDLKKHPKFQYADGCISDQVFGQGWAHQLGLGYIYPRENVLSALRSVWKYNWAPDVATQGKFHPPGRIYADPGEAGLLTCTWPKSKHLEGNAVRYKNEVWTGIEYQVANHMLYEGMVEEALAIVRAIHERYDGVKHNPWNEIECGDHYARGMASWGCLLGAAGFECHGPAERIGFAPRLLADDFQAFFSAAEGWGSLTQKRGGGKQTNRIEIKWGKLRAKTLAFELPEGKKLKSATLALAGKTLMAVTQQDGARVTLELPQAAVANPGEAFEATLTWSA